MSYQPDTFPNERKTSSHRGAGFDIVPVRPPGNASCNAQCHSGLPRGARCGLLFRLRGRPPACHRRGRSPPNQPTSDHADGATLGRWDAKASQRPRRPVLRAGSGAAAGFSIRGGDKIQRQDSAAETSDQRRMRPPGPDVHGHLRVVQGRANSRCEVRFQGHDESPRRRPLKSDFASTVGSA